MSSLRSACCGWMESPRPCWCRISSTVSMRCGGDEQWLGLIHNADGHRVAAPPRPRWPARAEWWAQLVGALRVCPHKHWADYPPQEDRGFARGGRVYLLSESTGLCG